MLNIFFIFFISLSTLFAKETSLLRNQIDIKIKAPITKPYEKDSFYLPIIIKNNSLKKLSSKQNFFLSYHLYDTKGKIIKWDGIRTPINIPPKKSKKVSIKIEPLKAGKYKLIFDLVKENEFWLSIDKKYQIEVEEYFKDYKKCTKESDKTCWFIEKEDDINKLNLLTKRALEQNAKCFENLKICGFSAGDSYPQIWIRDNYTILKTAKYYYDEKFFSWIFYFLTHLDKNRLVYDWVDKNGKVDKNSVESDQESSLTLSYFEILNLNSKKYIKYLPQISNLLKELWKQKRDKNLSLLTSAYTMDWGDVQYGVKDPIHKTKNSYIVAGMYENILFYKAVSKLIEIYETLGTRNKNIQFFKHLKRTLKENILKNFWHNSNGFFISNIHITPVKTPFDEKNIFPMGSNAIALSSDLIDDKKFSSIIKTALFRQKLFNFSTISGVLLPCYPENFFSHPSVKEYFHYQNGGQWDWFGGKIIKEMFLKDEFFYKAFKALKEIASKNIQNRGFYEWNDMIGKGYGARNYTASAASITESIIEGLFRIKIKNDTVVYIKETPLKKDFFINIKIPSLSKSFIYEQKNGKIYIKNFGFKQIIYISYSGKIVSITDNKSFQK